MGKEAFVICFVIGVFLSNSISCAPNLPTGISTDGEQMLVISTTDATEVTERDVTVLPKSSGESWEMDNNDLSGRDEDERPAEKESAPTTPTKLIKPEIYSFRIKSDVKYRYSRTHVTSRVANKDLGKSQEVKFRVVLPETAFISKFIMEIDGIPYEAYVKKKEEAKNIYSQAQSQGQSAGLVEVSTRNSNTFNVNVNIKAQSKVTFNLTYEELLTRRLGKYEQVINISPEHVKSVKDFKIEVNIEESQNITFLRVPNLRNDVESVSDAEGNNNDALIIKAGNKANISWSPSVKDQENLSSQGVGGKFVVQYDINRDSTSGEVLVMEGYFVHFFAPENLQPLRKHVTFILDVSGSMWGRKLEQLKDSQKKILGDLNVDDYFNIITFSNDVFLWSPNDTLTKHSSSAWSPPSFSARPSKKRGEGDPYKQQPYPATPENIIKAKAFIDSLVASGGTNIHDSIITAIKLTATIKRARDGIFSGPEVEDEELPEPMSMVDVLKMRNDSLVEGVTETGVTSSPTPSPTHPLPTYILPKNVESLIIFLTDGEPTVGVTDPGYIRELIQTANKNLSIPIFSLGFGEGADFPFVKKLSLQNYGFARKIYEASDAALQLKGFYNEIASPLLSNVLFNYTSTDYNVTEITVTHFPTVFGGTEVTISGRLIPLAISVPAANNLSTSTEASTTLTLSNGEIQVEEVSTILPGDDDEDAPSVIQDNGLVLSDRHFLDVGISGTGRDGVVDFKPPVVFCHPIDYDDILRPPFPPRPTPAPTQEDKFLEHLWAYLTIQQLIEKDLKDGDTKTNDISPAAVLVENNNSTTLANSTNPVNPETAKQKALSLALKYGFVTPFTSLVVVKPNSSDSVTNTVPSDAPSADAIDSFAAPQSVSFLAIAQPQALLGSMGWGNRIGGGGSAMPPSPMSHSPLYLSIRRPPSPIRATTSSGYKKTHSQSHHRTTPYQYQSTSFSFPSPPILSTVAFSSSFDAQTQSVELEEADYDNKGVEADLTTHIPSSDTLTLSDIQWFNSSFPILRINESDFTVSENTTSSSFVGSICTNKGELGRCVHLRDCLQDEFLSDFELFKASYFCPIQATSGISFVGVCCSPGQDQLTTMPVSYIIP